MRTLKGVKSEKKALILEPLEKKPRFKKAKKEFKKLGRFPKMACKLFGKRFNHPC